MRKELKIPIHKNNILIFKSWIDLIKNCRHEYDDRIVSSIYYDTEKFQSAQDNLDGISERKKYRLRWYNADTKNIVYEIKIKKNNLGKKIIYKTNSDFKDMQNFFSFTNKNLKSEKGHKLLENINHFDLKPKIEISYLRSYYIFKNKVRITFDRNLNYKLLEKLITNKKKLSDNICVIEIKFEEKDNLIAKEIIDNSLFVPKRFSKYLRGLYFFGKSIYI